MTVLPRSCSRRTPIPAIATDIETTKTIRIDARTTVIASVGPAPSMMPSAISMAGPTMNANMQGKVSDQYRRRPMLPLNKNHF